MRSRRRRRPEPIRSAGRLRSDPRRSQTTYKRSVKPDASRSAFSNAPAGGSAARVSVRSGSFPSGRSSGSFRAAGAAPEKAPDFCLALFLRQSAKIPASAEKLRKGIVKGAGAPLTLESFAPAKKTCPKASLFCWSWMRDSNSRPHDYESGALPAELIQHIPLGDRQAPLIVTQWFFNVNHKSDDFRIEYYYLLSPISTAFPSIFARLVKL